MLKPLDVADENLAGPYQREEFCGVVRQQGLRDLWQRDERDIRVL